MTHPSGAQFEIRHGPYSLTAVEVGGGIRQFSHGELEVIDGYPIDHMCHDARGAVLAPWPNRLADGRYTFDGQPQQLALTEPSHHNAIHGLVRWANWTERDRTDTSVTLAHTLFPQPGYPFILELSIRYALSDAGLEVEMEAVNVGDTACPFGAGHHPYLCVGTEPINDAEIRIPASSMYRYNEQLIPVEKIPVSGTPIDFQQRRLLGPTEINMDFTDLERDDDGMARVSMWSPAGACDVTVWMDEAFRHVTVYTGETVQPVERRRQGLAIEPMTSPPNAFASGENLVTLSPKERWVGRWGIVVDEIH